VSHFLNFMLNVVTLRVVMLNVILLSVVILNVVMLSVVAPLFTPVNYFHPSIIFTRKWFTFNHST